jgi:hypothetical protein
MPGFIVTGIRFAANDDLPLYDESCQRWFIIERLLKQGPAERAARDALGSGSPMIERSRMDTLIQRRHATEAINKLAGIVRERANDRESRERRVMLWWLLYDMQLRVEVAPRRIKVEQQLRAIAAQKSTLGDLRRYSALCGKSPTA